MKARAELVDSLRLKGHVGQDLLLATWPNAPQRAVRRLYTRMSARVPHAFRPISPRLHPTDMLVIAQTATNYLAGSRAKSGPEASHHLGQLAQLSPALKCVDVVIREGKGVCYSFKGMLWGYTQVEPLSGSVAHGSLHAMEATRTLSKSVVGGWRVTVGRRVQERWSTLPKIEIVSNGGK